MKNIIERLDPKTLSEADLKTMERIYSILTGDERPALVGREGVHIPLPDPIFHLLVRTVRAMQEGKIITLVPENEALTTQAAADFLGVSRPFLVGLLEKGEIPYHAVGAHRRVEFKDVAAYRQERNQKRRVGMEALYKAVEHAGVYDNTLPEDHAG